MRQPLDTPVALWSGLGLIVLADVGVPSRPQMRHLKTGASGLRGLTSRGPSLALQACMVCTTDLKAHHEN